jgi:hypothetical protein
VADVHRDARRLHLGEFVETSRTFHARFNNRFA